MAVDSAFLGPSRSGVPEAKILWGINGTAEEPEEGFQVSATFPKNIPHALKRAPIQLTLGMNPRPIARVGLSAA
jgi:hypothetical protein